MGDYERHGGHSRPYGGAGYAGGPYEYTGQPVGFEHLGSPPKQRLEDMDPKTIAQLGYEGPEGERRKAEAINEQMNERIYERERDAYNHPVPVPRIRTDYRDGYPDNRDRYYPDQARYRDEYYGDGRRGEYDRYNQGRSGPGYMIPSPVTVDRKVQEDGTVVEHVYPDNRVTSPYQRPDRNKIHYGRQDSFPEAALQEAATAYNRYPPGSAYPAGSSHAGYPVQGPGPGPYTSSSSPYGRRPPEYGNSSNYDPRY